MIDNFLIDFYSEKTDEKLSQDKFDNIINTYGDDYDSLINDLYSKYDAGNINEDKLNIIKNTYGLVEKKPPVEEKQKLEFNKDYDYSDLKKAKAKRFDKGIFKMAEREAFDKYKETGEIDLNLIPEREILEKRKYDYTKEVGGEYLINGEKVSRIELKDSLYDSDFIDKLQEGKVNVDIKNDERLEDLAKKQLESGSQLGDKGEAVLAALAQLASGAVDAQTFVDDTIEEITGAERFTEKYIGGAPKEVRDLLSEKLVDKVDDLHEKQRAYEYNFSESILNGNFANAANIGFNTVAESAPIMIAAGLTGGAGGVAGALTSAATMSGILIPAEYAATRFSEDEKLKELSKGEQLTRAFFRGGAEGFFEGIMGPIGAKSFGLFKEGLKTTVKRAAAQGGKEAAQSVAKEMADKTALEIFKAFGIDATKEGGTEALTSLSQDLTDDLLGVQDLSITDYLKNAGEAGALGIFMGGTVQSIGATGKVLLRNNKVKQGAISEIRKEQELGNISKKQGDELIRKVEDFQQAVKQTDSELSEEKQEEIANLIYEKTNLKQKIEGLDPNQESVKKSKERIQEIDNLISKTSASEAEIKLAEEQASIAKEIKDLRINKTVKFAETQGEKLGKKVYVVETDSEGSAGDKAQKIYDEFLKENPDQSSQDVSSADGFYLGDAIVINKDVVSKTGAFNTGQHEVLHGVINNAFNDLNTDQKKKLISDFRNILSDEQNQAINNRFKAYESDPNFDAETSVEIFTVLSDAIAKKEVAFNESFGSKLKNLLQEIFRKIGIVKDFSNARQAYNFLKDYNKTAEKGLISARALKLAQVAPIKQEISMSKTASENVQKIYEEQGVGGALDIIEEFKPIVNKLVQKRSEAPNFDRELLTSEIEIGLISKEPSPETGEYKQRSILGLIREYGPYVEKQKAAGEAVAPLAGFINKQLPKRMIEASQKILGESFTEDVSQRVDIAAPEVEVEIKTKEEKVPRSLRKKLNIEKGSDLYNKVKDAVVKTFGTKLPEVTDPKFKKALSDSYKRELKKEVNALMGTRSDFKMFVTNNAETLYKSIPQETINKRFQAFSEPVLDKEGKQVREKTAVGKGIFKKKPFNKEEFINYFLGEDVGASTKGTRKTALSETIADEMALDATMEVIEDPKVFEKFKEIQEIEGKEVPKDIKPKISEKVKRPEGFNFSKSVNEIINIRNLFQLETNGKDKLLKAYGLEESLKIKNEQDIDNYISMLKSDIFILGPKEMWFGPSGGSVFTSSSKIIGVKSSSNPLWKTFISRIKELESDSTIKYGKPIPGVNTKDIWSLRNKYDKLFKSPEIIEKNIKNGEIKKFNKQVAAIHKTLWERINKEISKDKNKATGIATYLGIVANDTGHWHKLGAQFEGYSKDITGKRYEYEHAMPATAAYLYLLDAALSDVNFSTAYDLVVDNYKLIALDKAMDDKLRNARTAKGYSLQRRMPDDWSVIDNFWWQRYFNDIVSSQDGGIDPNSIIGLDGKTFGEMFNVDASGNSTTVEVEKLKSKAKNINVKNLSNNVVNFSKTTNNEGIIGYAKTVDEALKVARDPNAPIKKIRVFDFDDTLARSKSLVFYNRQNDSGKPVPNNKAIFMIGGPGSGKSNIGKGLQLGRDGWKVVNQDIFIEAEKAKQGLPEIEKDYTKEQRSKRAKIGAAGRKAAEAKMDKYTKAGNGMVIDGTGASYNATMKKVNKLKEQGYEVFMVHAETSTEAAIARNKSRKERSLPSFIVEKTSKAVQESVKKYREELGDKFIEIDTETIEYGKPLPKEFVNKVKAKVYENERGVLNAEKFAKDGKSLIDKGAVMDFTDFNIVREGEKGPLFDVAKKIQKARGTDDVFVLTARAPESQQAIYEFLKSEGLEIPLKNITGLGNSTGEAKANWLVEKAAEGYNDFYFADDAYQNVKAVKDAMSVLDVKSKVQQAKINFSKSVNEDFNKIIEQTTGIASEKIYSEAKAKVRGANKGNKKFFIPYSAEDFMGLIYPLLSKGKLGDSQMAWFKKNLLDPYARANENIAADRLQLMEDFKALKKALEVPKDLRKKTDSGFTKEQAVRVYLFNKAGFDVPGISKTDLNELLDLVNSDGVLKAFGDQILNVTKGDGYAKPGENWLVGTITTDLIDVLNTVKRAKYLEQSGFTANTELIFSKENLNKLEAAYGSKYREAMENVLGRMKSGKNRIFSGNRLSNRVLDYINNSTGAIMFFNTRSAVLQTISSINFLNWSFNNPIKAGAAFANQPQYWKDFVELINSDYLVDRRNGLKLNINESEIADAAATSKNKAKAAINYILQKGFLPTQYADSFAIASGGATFYRNRINDLIKNQGMSEADAKKQAMLEWRETAEVSQQSSDPSKISAQQASDLGRVILAFANTPMQYARIQKRAVQDLINGRGDAKTHVSKIIYYAVVQNLIFNALQSALFGLGFGDDEDDEKKEKMYLRTANGMLDSQLRGLGLAGATVAVIKNFLTDIYERSGRQRPEYVDSIYKLLQISPPISSKISKIRGAAWQFDSKKRRQEIFDKGFSIDNPAYEAGAKVISATANIPLDRVYSKVNNISGAMDEDAETWQTIAMLAGWPKWQIMPKEKEVSTFNNGSVKIKSTESSDYIKLKKLNKSEQIKMLKDLGAGSTAIRKAKKEDDRIELIMNYSKEQ